MTRFAMPALVLACRAIEPGQDPRDPEISAAVLTDSAPTPADSGAAADTLPPTDSEGGDQGSDDPAARDSGGSTDGTEPGPTADTGSDTAVEEVIQPSGDWIAVTAGAYHTCALHADGSAACWGDNTSGQTDAPADLFTAISAASTETCGIRTDGTILCWGLPMGGIVDSAPEGSFVRVACGYDVCAALDAAGEMAWWGREDYVDGEAPEGPFLDANAGGGVCTVDGGGAVWCIWESLWAESSGEYTVTSSGAVQVASVASEDGCWLDADGWITCWGANYPASRTSTRTIPQLVQMDLTETVACGVTTAAEAICWGDDIPWYGTNANEAPPGYFTQVAAGIHHACGVNLYGGMECWGADAYGEATAP